MHVAGEERAMKRRKTKKEEEAKEREDRQSAVLTAFAESRHKNNLNKLKRRKNKNLFVQFDKQKTWGKKKTNKNLGEILLSSGFNLFLLLGRQQKLPSLSLFRFYTHTHTQPHTTATTNKECRRKLVSLKSC